MTRQYITTAIDYPNAAPHMGHVLEKVLADVCARWMRLRGDEVRFQIGTDEHGIKIQQTAEKEKISPKALVDRNVATFMDLYEKLAISFDIFVRTTDRKRHWPTVIAFWRKLRDAGVLTKRTYTGLYCSGCERFLMKRELVDGLCPDHQKAPEEVEEENWFFALSAEEKFLNALLTNKKGDLRIIPASRSREVLGLIEKGLVDSSFSRPITSVSWGIPVPDDESQTMYVWCDALTNYISTLGFFTDDEDCTWWDGAIVTHVIGKDIARFHALLWPAMLRNGGMKIPDQLLIHGHLTSDGQKMSKSIGNVVKPDDVLAKFGGNPDPLRFYLSHEVPVGNDGDFSWKRIEELYIGVLSNKIGNLLNRVLVLLQKDGGAFSLQKDDEMTEHISDVWKKFSGEMDAFDLSKAIGQAVALAVAGNMEMEKKKPWTLTGEEKTAVLGAIAEKLRHIALMLLPFMPSTAQQMSMQLGVEYAGEMLKNSFVITEEMKVWGGMKKWTRVGNPAILFAQLK